MTSSIGYVSWIAKVSVPSATVSVKVVCQHIT